MRRLEFYIILTADGMYADPDGGLDHYDPAEDEHRYANGLTRDAGDIVMGRVMYDVMEYWDTLDLDDPAVPGRGARVRGGVAGDAEARPLPWPAGAPWQRRSRRR